MVLWWLTSGLGIHYLASTVIAFVSITPLGFFLNKAVTFRTRREYARIELPRYFSAMAASFALNLLLMYLLVSVLGVWYLTASLLVAAVVLIVNFLSSDRWRISGAAMSSGSQPRIAVVHEWLLDFAGSERVLREILDLYPQADLFALVDLPNEELQAAIPKRAKGTSFLQSLPRPQRWLRYYLPLMPLAIEQLDVSAYDIVVLSSHAVAKGVITGPSQLHLSYVVHPDALRMGSAARVLARRGTRARPIKLGGAHGAAPPAAVGRAQCEWRRRVRGRFGPRRAPHPKGVPPGRRGSVSAGRDFGFPDEGVERGFLPDRVSPGVLQAGRPSRRSISRMPERRLVVIGDGPEMRRLRSRPLPNVEVLGRLPTPAVCDYLQRARAFLFAGIEDFGIVMVEAQACGTPVIAFGSGGAAEIVQSDTGVLFPSRPRRR